MLLLGAHHLMSGGFADCSCYSRASHAVLSGGDPIRERLARHLHRPRLPPPLLSWSACDESGDGSRRTRASPLQNASGPLPVAPARRPPRSRGFKREEGRTRASLAGDGGGGGGTGGAPRLYGLRSCARPASPRAPAASPGGPGARAPRIPAGQLQDARGSPRAWAWGEGGL